MSATVLPSVETRRAVFRHLYLLVLRRVIDADVQYRRRRKARDIPMRMLRHSVVSSHSLLIVVRSNLPGTGHDGSGSDQSDAANMVGRTLSIERSSEARSLNLVSGICRAGTLRAKRICPAPCIFYMFQVGKSYKKRGVLSFSLTAATWAPFLGSPLVAAPKVPKGCGEVLV
jgi:hypothetical protein